MAQGDWQANRRPERMVDSAAARIDQPELGPYLSR